MCNSGNGQFVSPMTRTVALGLKPSGNSFLYRGWQTDRCPPTHMIIMYYFPRTQWKLNPNEKFPIYGVRQLGHGCPRCQQSQNMSQSFSKVLHSLRVPITSVRRSWPMQINSDLWKVSYMWWYNNRKWPRCIIKIIGIHCLHFYKVRLHVSWP